MGSDPRAKLFYGYIQPVDEEEQEDEEGEEEKTGWSALYAEGAHGCTGGIYGVDAALGFF